MRTMLRFLMLSVALAALTGCGYMVQVNKKVEYTTVALGTRRGDLWKSAARDCPACTEAFLKSNWGEPDARMVDEAGTTVWTYHNGLKWVGASPVILIPLPLFAPSGKEKIQFGLKEGRIVFVKHLTTRRMFLYLPAVNENDITVSLYQGQVPSTGCVFTQAP